MSIFGNQNWLTNLNLMTKSFLFVFIFCSQIVFSQVVLNADGPGSTYSLITSVLAPGHNPIEVPDCNHSAFGDHIDEVFDSALNTNVFRFHIHTSPDNDRCINFDRQRNEIKTYDKSPDNLLGIEDETVIYKWKFKLNEGFQSSSSFTHIHQLKSVGGSLASMPMYTLTTRKSSPDRLELRYAVTNSQITLKQTDLAPLINTWLEVTETIKYGISGTYDIVIKKVSDGTTLFSYTNNNIINWRENADFVRPKWGVYRSLNNSQDLRDEIILFANFSIEEVETLSLADTKITNNLEIFIPNPVKNILQLKNLTDKVDFIQIVSLEGKKIIDSPVNSKTTLTIDVSAISNGTYIVHLIGKQFKQSKLILIAQ